MPEEPWIFVGFFVAKKTVRTVGITINCDRFLSNI